MKVKDVMGTAAVAVRPGMPFADLVAVMRSLETSAVVVVDEERRPLGVVSEDDLLLKEIDPPAPAGSLFEGRARRREHRKAAGATAAELMTAPAITVTEATPVRDAARLMHDHRVKQLPVIDALTGRVAGTVRQGDLLKIFSRPAGEIDREITAVCERLHVSREWMDVAVEAGVVTLTGRIGFHSQILPLVAAIRAIDGVLAVQEDLGHEADDLIRIPPLYLM
ncbi:CBS domain-containing protein [Planomonospora corallina]|uniref:CBS domain-containing protein n=1 Tax=Planomonospora corallina TaxID=1806052 RepID=A0ABV8IBQ6_9ACTN